MSMISDIVFEMICTAKGKASEAALVIICSPSVPYTFKLVANDGFRVTISLNNTKLIF